MSKTYTDSALSDMVVSHLKSFKQDREYTYIKAIDSMMPLNRHHITIDFAKLPHEISDSFIVSPGRTLEAMKRAVLEVLRAGKPEYADSIAKDVSVRISNFPGQKSLREIKSSDTGKFLGIKAIVIRLSTSESIPISGVFRCPAGHETSSVAGDNYIMDVPTICSNPDCKHYGKDLDPILERFEFVDYQIISLQELPDELPPGKLPKNMSVFVVGELVDMARMGDTVEITGMIKAELSNEIKLGKKVQTYRQRLYANNIMAMTGEDGATEDDIKITKREENQILRLREMSEEDATRSIISSFAPHIYGYEIIKESLILTMIGSDTTTLEDGTRIRGDINMFLLGDPGTAKSEMGKATYRASPRAFYTSGRGSSGAGLTAATIQDKTTGVFMLEPGITVLADQGLAVIDEFDKMRPEDRSALHEVMEQQSVSISKGGITATLNARASVVALANPTYGRYDVEKNLTENIKSIPIPLITRFDLIFVIKDEISKEKDSMVAHHIIRSHKNQSNDDTHQAFSGEMFTKYLKYARQLKPKLTKEAEDEIVSYYIKMRTDGDDGYVITPRQLEGLIRLSTARAKMLLKDEIGVTDAQRAIYIMDKMLETSSIDVNTGRRDIGVLEGKPRSEMNLKEKFFEIIGKVCENAGPGIGVSSKEITMALVDSEEFTEQKATQWFTKAIREGYLFEISFDKYDLVQ